MAPSSQAQLTALRVLAAELSGERRLFHRELLEPRLMAQLQLEGPCPGPIPVVLIDVSSGGVKAAARSGLALRIGSVGRLVTGGADGCEGERQVRVAWSRPEGGAQLLGLAFIATTCFAKRPCGP